MSQKKTNASGTSETEIIARNRKASHEYELLDQLECGLVLKGSEVKSLRNHKASLDEAYARVRDGELFLLGCDIAEYPQANVMNHEPRRPRKLLLHKRQLEKFAAAAEQQGLTLIPLSLYFLKGRVKVTIALARGRKLHDKREKLKSTADRREMRTEMLKRK